MSVHMAGKSLYLRLSLGCLCFLGLVLNPSTRDWNAAYASAAQSERAFSLRVDVELVTTEVIVLDKKGKPVRNLKKENFRLYEDGKQQEIASFDEVTDETGGASSMGAAGMDDDGLNPGKTVLIIFDDSSITSAHIKQSRDSARRFVEEHMRPQDLFAVASFSHSLKILQNLTHDQEEILKAIDQPAVSSADPVRRPDMPVEQKPGGGRWPSADPSSMDTGRSAGMRTSYQAENLLRALNSISLAIEHLKGQKSVLLFSEAVPFNVGAIETVYRNTLNSAKRSNVVFYTLDPGGLDSGTIGEGRPPAKNGGASPSVPSDRSAFSSGRLQLGSGILSSFRNSMFQQTGGTQGGGTGGTTGGTTTGGTGGTGGSTSGGTSGTTGGTTGSSRGGYSSGNTAGYPGGSSYPGYTNPDLNSSWDRASSTGLLRSLASETGGISIYNTNDFDGELDKLDQQLSNYYILGFQSNNPKHDGAFRKLEVKTDLKGVTLRYRKGYLDRRPIDTLASSKQEKTLLNALASPAPATQLPVFFRPAYFYDSPRMARVLVMAKIRMEKIEIKKKGGQLGSDLNVMGVAYAEDGGVSARFSETLHITFDKDKEQDFRKTNLSYRNYFRLRPGKYRLKLATSDEANNLGSMEQSLEVPALPERGFAASSLVLAEHIYRLPDLIQNLQAQLLDDIDPLIYAGMQISPSVENRLPANSAIPVLYKVYDLAGGSNQWKLTAKARLMSEKGEELTLPPIPLKDNLSLVSKAEGVIGFTLTFTDAAPGKYRLMIETADAASAEKTATVQADLELTGN